MHRNRRIQKNVKQTPRRATKKSIRLRRHIYFDLKHHPSNANKWIQTRGYKLEIKEKDYN